MPDVDAEYEETIWFPVVPGNSETACGTCVEMSIGRFESRNQTINVRPPLNERNVQRFLSAFRYARDRARRKYSDVNIYMDGDGIVGDSWQLAAALADLYVRTDKPRDQRVTLVATGKVDETEEVLDGSDGEILEVKAAAVIEFARKRPDKQVIFLYPGHKTLAVRSDLPPKLKMIGVGTVKEAMLAVPLLPGRPWALASVVIGCVSLRACDEINASICHVAERVILGTKV